MRYLLDVNALVALGWQDHVHHDGVAVWVSLRMAEPTTEILTSAIPELGFVRVSVLRSGGRASVSKATETLKGLLDDLGMSRVFVADDQSATSVWPPWCRNASNTTDAHLLELADSVGGFLATLDEGIPGALLIPLK